MTKHLFEREADLLNTTERRVMARIRVDAARKFRRVWVHALKRHGWTNVAIAKELRISESTVRTILKEKI